MLNTGFNHDGPVAIRYPRGEAKDKFEKDKSCIDFWKERLIKEAKSEEVVILSFGSVWSLLWKFLIWHRRSNNY